MQTLPSHPPLSCKNERKLCNQVSGVLLTYLLLMNLTVIAAMLVEAGLRLIHLGTLGYGLNAALHRVMQPDYLTQLLQSGTGYLVVSGLCLLLILLWKGRSFYRDVFRPGWPMSGPVFWQLLSVFMAIQVLSSVFSTLVETLLNRWGLTAMQALLQASDMDSSPGMMLYAAVSFPPCSSACSTGTWCRSPLPSW